jgi:hypothetical protein
MRDAVVDNISRDNIIEFVEVEYRPKSQEVQKSYNAPWNSAWEPRILSNKPEINTTQAHSMINSKPNRSAPSIENNLQQVNIGVEEWSEKKSTPPAAKIREVPRALVIFDPAKGIRGIIGEGIHGRHR